MNTIVLKRKNILTFTIGSWILFLALSFYDISQLQLLNIFGFLFLTIIPGLLTLLAIRLDRLNFWGYVSLIVSFSLLELMAVGLLGNTLLPYLGVSHPLNRLVLIPEISFLVLVLLTIVWFRIKNLEVHINRSAIFEKFRDVAFSFIPIIFVVFSIFGAIRLNNGASNILTMVMLGGMGLYLFFLIMNAEKLGENTIPTALFFVSLSLLLMTSLRGWYITGHDIQSEYKVFQIAKNAGIWQISAYRDAYNACMSITILPTIFSNLLNLADPYVYKILYQIFFAFCPGIVYLIGRRWTKPTIALLGAIYFIAFPTFFSDMPFLNRQEMAFIFFALMAYVIFESELSLSLRRWIFMFMGAGVILSHYSTTYTVLLIFGLTVASRPIFLKLLERFKEKPILRNSSLIRLDSGEIVEKAKITLGMIIVLFALSFFWTSIITQTGGSVVRVITETAAAVKNGFAGDNRSIDVSTLLSFTKPDQGKELESYIVKRIDPIRKSASVGDYYEKGVYDKYPITFSGSENTPLNKAGQFFANIHININLFLSILGQLLSKLTEVLVPVGMIYILLRNDIVQRVDHELYLIALFCLFFIALNLALPVLSIEYGIFRALQQSMFIIAPIIVIGIIALGDGLMKLVKVNGSGTKFAILFTITLFLYSTHFMPYLFGGNSAVLHLSNAGNYYDDYLIQTTEVYGVQWLSNVTKLSSANGVRLEVQTSRYSKFASLTPLNPYTDILPAVVRKDSYVFLAPITVLKGRATVVYNADQINYNYPIQFLQDNKNLIYSNGGAKVYR